MALKNFLLTILLPAAILTSCLDIQGGIVIKRNGSADIQLEYILDQRSAEFGRSFGSDDPWPLPLTEKDFRLKTLRNTGVSLRRYRMKRTSNETEHIIVNLRAESVAALSDYLDWDMRYLIDDESRNLSISIPAMNPRIDDSLRKLVEKMTGDSQVIIRIQGPGKPSRIEGGRLEGRSAVFQADLSSMIFSTEPSLWSVTW